MCEHEKTMMSNPAAGARRQNTNLGLLRNVYQGLANKILMRLQKWLMILGKY